MEQVLEGYVLKNERGEYIALTESGYPCDASGILDIRYFETRWPADSYAERMKLYNLTVAKVRLTEVQDDASS